MDDGARNLDKPPAAGPPVALPYQSPGANAKSQWITDDQPGGAWLVGCLLVLCGLGAVLGAAAWVLSSLFSGMGI